MHLAQHTSTHLLGNFLGDFVKGKQWQQLPIELQKGVQLHRWIDSYTDRSPIVQQLTRIFPQGVQRYAGIAIDIYFDHLLVTSWSDYCEYPADDLYSRFYQQLENSPKMLPVNAHFYRVRRGLLERRWLAHYGNQVTCLKAMRAIEHRSRFTLDFAETCYHVLRTHHGTFVQHFTEFYPQLLFSAQKYVNESFKCQETLA